MAQQAQPRSGRHWPLGAAVWLALAGAAPAAAAGEELMVKLRELHAWLSFPFLLAGVVVTVLGAYLWQQNLEAGKALVGFGILALIVRFALATWLGG